MQQDRSYPQASGYDNDHNWLTSYDAGLFGLADDAGQAVEVRSNEVAGHTNYFSQGQLRTMFNDPLHPNNQDDHHNYLGREYSRRDIPDDISIQPSFLFARQVPSEHPSLWQRVASQQTPEFTDLPLYPQYDTSSQFDESSESSSPSPEMRGAVRGKVEQAETPYNQILYECLLQAPRYEMTLQDIYRWFAQTIPERFSLSEKGWQNSIRHNLSMNPAFEKATRDDASGARLHFWKLSQAALENGVEPTTRYRRRDERRPIKKRVNLNSVAHRAIAREKYARPTRRSHRLRNAPIGRTLRSQMHASPAPFDSRATSSSRSIGGDSVYHDLLMDAFDSPYYASSRSSTPISTQSIGTGSSMPLNTSVDSLEQSFGQEPDYHNGEGGIMQLEKGWDTFPTRSSLNFDMSNHSAQDSLNFNLGKCDQFATFADNAASRYYNTPSDYLPRSCWPSRAYDDGLSFNAMPHGHINAIPGIVHQTFQAPMTGVPSHHNDTSEYRLTNKLEGLTLPMVERLDHALLPVDPKLTDSDDYDLGLLEEGLFLRDDHKSHL